MKKYAGLSNAGVSNTVRKGVYRRDGYMCAVCGDPRSLQIHHFAPRGRGGSDEPSNLITLCGVCHGVVHKKITPPSGMKVVDYVEAMRVYLENFYGE